MSGHAADVSVRSRATYIPPAKTCSSFSHESAEQAEWYVSAPFVTLPSTIAQGNEDRLYRQGARNSMSNLVFDESSSNREASHGYAWWFSGDTFEKAMAEERKPRKRSLMHRLTTHPGRLTILYFMMLGVLSTLLLLTPPPRRKASKRHSPPRSSPRSPRFRRVASPSSIRRRIGPLSARPCSSSPCRWAAWVS